MQDSRDQPDLNAVDTVDAALRLDGNAAAGLLDTIFPFEMTLARASCDGCGNEYQIATLIAYTHAPGLVLRCPDCDTALIRITHINSQYWLDLRGTRTLILIDK